ncbi:MAG TPA: hypothetical protein PKC21_10085 [Oligoflexia bacterium]|nr:hypothetical protein [Oligoflexia bacterium]HMR25689.1 hypothetical protein [Oligoflexia bacterium]
MNKYPTVNEYLFIRFALKNLHDLRSIRYKHWEPMNKEKRQSILVELIKKQRLSSHEELIVALKKRGVMAGQATISRDMRELSIVKKSNIYCIENDPSSVEASWERVFKERIHYIEQAGPHLLVVRGILGSAPIISVEIEAMNWPEIVGVIAGDDTLFFAFKKEKDLQKIKQRFISLLR